MSALGQKQTCAVQGIMSALPSKATSNAPYKMSAKGKKRNHAAQQKESLFDHHVGAGKERRRNDKSNRARCTKIYCQLDFRWLLKRQLGYLGTP